jgi:DNA modification methylase
LTVYYQDHSVQLLNGDVLDMLKTLPNEYVQTVVTSPPYWGLRDYGIEGQLGLEPTPDAYVAKMVQVFREVRRVLKDDGTLWLNLGDSYCSSATGSASQSASTLGGGKYTQEEACKRPDKLPKGFKAKDLVGIPWRVAFALQADGWYLRSDIIWAKPNPMPESVTDRPTKAHEYLFLMSKQERYWYDHEAIREASNYTWNSAKSTLAANGVKNVALNKSGQRRTAGADTFHKDEEQTGRNKRTVWSICSDPYPEAHFATFPPKLIEPCILAGSRTGDTVLDPFHGAGTTAMVSKQFGRRYVGIELNPAYLALSMKRIQQEALPL